MTIAPVPLKDPSRLYIDGQWVEPKGSGAFDVVDSISERIYFSVPEASAADMERAIAAAKQAFDNGPWPRLTHPERAVFLRRIADAIERRTDDFAQVWPRQSGILHAAAQANVSMIPGVFRFYADLADTYPFQEQVVPRQAEFGLLVREPVGVVGAIIPWNSPLALMTNKVAPALLAGCTLVLKASPEAPGEAYLLAEIVEEVGLPPGVVNVLTADREVSQLLVTDQRVDKIAFTGSTEAGRHIASLLGQRIGRYTLELGGKSAAVILDDFDLGDAARILARAECYISGQVCSSLTRIVVSQHRHDELVDALASEFANVTVGDPFAPGVQMGPLASERQLQRVNELMATGVAEGASLAAGGRRPSHLDVGYFVEPTVFGDVDNSSTIAQTEIFGPVLTVIPAQNELDAIEVANDTIYGLNASVFTNDVDRARHVASRLRSGTVGHNAFRSDFSIAFGGFKQSGIGREGGREGLLPYLETKTVILDAVPSDYR